MSTAKITAEEISAALNTMGEKAVAASRVLAKMPAADKNQCLCRMADELWNAREEIFCANAKDMQAGRKNGLSSAMLDRLELTPERLQAMADGLRQVASQSDPVGQVISSICRPNGLKIDKVSVPLGVIGIIFESRPNVTADAAGICLKAGNTVILRGGSEAIHSNLAIAGAMNRAGVLSGLPDGAVQLIPWTDRQAVSAMLKLDKYIDLIIPRGGEGLIRAVVEQSTIPVIKHYKGVCHLYVDKSCDIDMAVKIVENAKCQRPGVCNALETLLIAREAVERFLPPFVKVMRDKKVELRGEEEFCKLVPEAVCGDESDYYAEYLDYILAVKLVDDVQEAVDHINKYGSRHSDGILSTIPENIDYFFASVDSSTVYCNASTRFTDGGEFGMGAEIGISTDKLHARGPMGVNELVTYKYLVRGEGQIR